MKRQFPAQSRGLPKAAASVAGAACLIVLSGFFGGLQAQAEEGDRSIGLETSSYFFSNQTTKENFFPSFAASLSGTTAGERFEAVGSAKLKLTYRPGGTTAAYEFPEAYVGTRPPADLAEQDTSVVFRLGRKKESWSHLDDQWQLGIWQPRFRWDYIEPETVGLFGAFMTIEAPRVKFVAFVSPVFVPERGAPISVENGSVISSSPWFVPPPSTVNWKNQATAVQYGLQVPPINEIVSHPGGGVMLQVGDSEHIWANVAYSYKPMNQLLLAYDVHMQLDNESQNIAKVDIYPRVAYHHLATLEAGFTARDLKGWIAAVSDRPVRDVTQPTWVTQEVSPAVALSPSFDVTVGGPKGDPTVLQLSYLRVWGGNAPDGGGLGFGSGSVFDTRYPFQEAATVGLQSSLGGFGGGRRLHGSLKLLQDFEHPGQMLSLGLKYQPKRSWEVTLGADILGSESPADASSAGSDFISRYRDHDRIHAGVAYVF